MRYRLILLMIVAGLLAISALTPPFHGYFWMEHALTLLLIGYLVYVERRGGPLSNASYTFIFAYLLLHTVGGHYTYTQVPYDEWSQAIFGASVSEQTGWRRNHFDRLIHLFFGLVLMYPMHEIVKRHMKLAGIAALLVAGAFIATISSLYELLEWLISVMLSPEAAESYNGQQGDMFDAQKDHGLALLGAALAGAAIAIAQRKQKKPTH